MLSEEDEVMLLLSDKIIGVDCIYHLDIEPSILDCKFWENQFITFQRLHKIITLRNSKLFLMVSHTFIKLCASVKNNCIIGKSNNCKSITLQLQVNSTTFPVYSYCLYSLIYVRKPLITPQQWLTCQVKAFWWCQIQLIQH